MDVLPNGKAILFLRLLNVFSEKPTVSNSSWNRGGNESAIWGL
jgi:hypothetical protein